MIAALAISLVVMVVLVTVFVSVAGPGLYWLSERVGDRWQTRSGIRAFAELCAVLVAVAVVIAFFSIATAVDQSLTEVFNR